MLNESEVDNNCELVCRACRTISHEQNQMINLHSFNVNNIEFHKVSDLFSKYTFLEIGENDSITTYICLNCYKILADFHKFRQMCVDSYNEFLKQKEIDAGVKVKDPLVSGSVKDLDPVVKVKVERLDENDMQQMTFSCNNENLTSGPVGMQFGEEIKVEPSLDAIMFCESNFGDPNNSEEAQMDHINQYTANQTRDKTYKYKCTQCPQAYQRSQALKRHELWHRGVKNFECFDCHLKKFTATELKRHMAVHTKSNQLPCEICLRSFYSITNLRLHLKRVHRARLRQNGFACIICDKLFNGADGFREHEKECVFKKKLEEKIRDNNDPNIVEPQYFCDFCSASYRLNSSLIWHTQSKHYATKRKLEYECMCCEKRFENVEKIKEHLEQQSQEVLKAKWEAKLQEKRAREATQVEKLKKCDFCSRTFNRKSSMKRHLNWHQGIRNHLCSQCGFKAITKYELQSHINTHTRQIQVTCEFCGRILQAKDTLLKHRRLIHYTEKQTDDKYKCILCNERLGNVAEMDKHGNMHKEQKSMSEIRRELESLGKKQRHKQTKHLECNICHKKYSCNSTFDRHISSHRNLRNILCPICGPKSKWNSNADLSTHMLKVHRNKSNYPCKICSIKFSSMTEWQEHRSSVHLESIASSTSIDEANNVKK